MAVEEAVRSGLDAFRAFLRNRGFKCTDQRLRVADQALRQRGHASAEEIVAALRRRASGPTSKATVYRTLVLLEESGLLEGHDFGDGFKCYEPAFGVDHHDHLICVHCRRIVEFSDSRIEAAQEEVAVRHGFRITSHKHRIFGVCRDCS